MIVGAILNPLKSSYDANHAGYEPREIFALPSMLVPCLLRLAFLCGLFFQKIVYTCYRMRSPFFFSFGDSFTRIY